MNFIGHATVALWQRTEPEFVLGSMLPDFATMAGGRLMQARRVDALGAGIALHHQTDDVFHGTPVFVQLSRRALDRLTAVAVPRGAARAVAHIGVEMLIDGELVRASEVAEAYLAALEVGEGADALFADEAATQRYRALRTRLRAFGPPHDYRDPVAVVTRLTHALRGRPRLALDSAAARAVHAYLPELQREVMAALPELLADLRAALHHVPT